jgi:hypothetical protein
LGKEKSGLNSAARELSNGDGLEHPVELIVDVVREERTYDNREDDRLLHGILLRVGIGKAMSLYTLRESRQARFWECD